MSTSHSLYIALSYAACVGILATLVWRSAYTYFKTRRELQGTARNRMSLDDFRG